MVDYPEALERRHILADGRSVVIRPIRAEDEAATRVFFQRLCPESLRMRFMKFVRQLNDRLLHGFTHVDYESRMAFVCETVVAGEPRLVGEARYAAIENIRSCDFGIVIADEWRKTGIAGLLMLALMDHARSRGFETMESIVLRDNRDMLRFVRALGFEVRKVPGEPTVLQVTKRLARYAGAGSPSPN
ncbi:MAG TPA: GNAT family N-acetyltransferase [Burkholderiales bacterium]|jgi:acetyltransferase|nr:GNAT family N-acetyltransferase [Burkholderiales bacterium]